LEGVVVGWEWEWIGDEYPNEDRFGEDEVKNIGSKKEKDCRGARVEALRAGRRKKFIR
jgi:hypothetical protein